MKHSVASFFLLVSLLSGISLAQTRNQGAKKPRERPAQRASELKICQGVAIPDGYVIVGYVTSSACPHGAYVLRQQDPPVANSSAVAPTPGLAQTLSRPRRVGIDQSSGMVQSSGASKSSGVFQNSAAQSEPDTLTSSEPSAPQLIGNVPRDRTAPQLNAQAPLVSIPLKATPAPVPAPTAEEVSAGDVIRIETTLVAVPVSVLDRDGRFVPDLQRRDFRVYENGIEQKIAYFEPTEKPFTVALLLDTSASTRFHLWEIKEAAIAFAKQLRPQDRVLVATFNEEVLLLTEATSDQELISSVIEMNARSGQSTRLYDAVNLIISERLNKIQGRKAIVLFTDGVDTSSYIATYHSTLREAEELDALIYPIQYDTTSYMRAMQGAGNITIVTSNSNWPFPGRTSSRTIYGLPSSGSSIPGSTKADYDRADRYLHGLADRTGGRMYFANDSTQLAQAFASIAEELRRQYSLGYYPQTGAIQAGERRMIKVSVERPNVAVRARNSYMQKTAPTTQ